MKAIKTCLVCGRDGAKPKKLPSGAVADLCPECAADDLFRIPEAERRVRAA